MMAQCSLMPLGFCEVDMSLNFEIRDGTRLNPIENDPPYPCICDHSTQPTAQPTAQPGYADHDISIGDASVSARYHAVPCDNMDGFSIAASIIAVLQITSEVVEYLKDVKDAPKECQQCLREASNLHNLLINLVYHTNRGSADEPWYTDVRALLVEKGPVDQYKQALTELLSRVENQNGVQKIKQRLLWKFSKAEVASILARMERLKSLIAVALKLDHLWVPSVCSITCLG